MYAGRIVEQATVDELFDEPAAPVHVGPARLAARRRRASVDRLAQIPGQPPSLLNPPPGCAFHPRCSYVFEPLRHATCPSSFRPRPGATTSIAATSRTSGAADIALVMLPVIGTGEAA